MPVKHGSSRSVILVGNYAIKFPRVWTWRSFWRGFIHNLNEREWSGFAPQLCPVLFCFPGGLFLIMPRCRPLTRKDYMGLCMKEMLIYQGTCLPAEDKIDSFGWHKEKIVIIDYG